jgi:hypothetical protein
MIEVAATATAKDDVTSCCRLRLRQALPDDRERLCEFITRSGLEAAGTLEPGSRFWVVESADGQIAACTGIEYGQAAVLFRSTAVAREFRHRGLALSLYEFRFAVAMVEGYTVAYGFCDTPLFMSRSGWRAIPVEELVSALPDSHQVTHFARIGWLPNELAFRRDLTTRWDDAIS